MSKTMKEMGDLSKLPKANQSSLTNYLLLMQCALESGITEVQSDIVQLSTEPFKNIKSIEIGNSGHYEITLTTGPGLTLNCFIEQFSHMEPNSLVTITGDDGGWSNLGSIVIFENKVIVSYCEPYALDAQLNKIYGVDCILRRAHNTPNLRKYQILIDARSLDIDDVYHIVDNIKYYVSDIVTDKDDRYIILLTLDQAMSLHQFSRAFGKVLLDSVLILNYPDGTNVDLGELELNDDGIAIHTTT